MRQLHQGMGELRKLTRDRGLVARADDGMRHIRNGLATPAEVMRVTRA